MLWHASLLTFLVVNCHASLLGTTVDLIKKNNGCQNQHHRVSSLNLNVNNDSKSLFVPFTNLTCLTVLQSFVKPLQSKRVCLSWLLQPDVPLSNRKAEKGLRLVVMKVSRFQQPRYFRLKKWQRDFQHPQRVNAVIKKWRTQDNKESIRSQFCLDIMPYHQIVVYLEEGYSPPTFQGMLVEIRKNNVSFKKAMTLCPDGHLCDDGKCVDDARSVCDGIRQCPHDDSDEFKCLNFVNHTASESYKKKLPIHYLMVKTSVGQKQKSSFQSSFYEASNSSDNSSWHENLCQPPFYFECSSSTNSTRKCIPTHQLCDGSIDCDDWSDEKDCTRGNCTKPNYFLCDNGNCTLKSWFCDGKDDCGDNSDETNCTKDATPKHCSLGKWRCLNGRCISEQGRCDGFDHCGDNSDEISCSTETTPNYCQFGQWRCLNGRCISEQGRCDGFDHCGDNSDEISCSVCPFYMFQCDGTKCIEQSSVCDGYYDCSDSTDEQNCDLINILRTKRPCGRAEWKCNNDKCVDQFVRCDGENDCGDNSDENFCPREKICRMDEFRCTNNRCVSRSFLCDGDNDCGDWSDEKNKNCKCPLSLWSCSTGNQCISPALLCDGSKDCKDGSDEFICGSKSIVPNLFLWIFGTMLCLFVFIMGVIVRRRRCQRIRQRQLQRQRVTQAIICASLENMTSSQTQLIDLSPPTYEQATLPNYQEALQMTENLTSSQHP